LDMSRRLESPLWTAHCLSDYAVHLRASDVPTAAHMLNEARAVCEAHGLKALGQQVERRLAEIRG
ncbi:MAG: hypothetical protein ACRDKW_12425, partial [Actinomycetota bacterium]